ncbi:hypothetical protein AVEN_3832-1 [Araneus ventricosus]|uniref:Uncharacterized protein n=1 Tax=Araneus ventricosus TaxID=182803 RepID=A0A4Y2GQ04_ARAVE|nr:hypothetical protein AVEN_3832-1 [Araneus ventricosus]
MSLQNLSDTTSCYLSVTTPSQPLGCDGANVNTGWKGGVMHLLETYIGRPLHWKISMLHTNELPVRHLILEMDGCTKGPYSYSGPIGLLLKGCEKIHLSNLVKLTVVFSLWI